MLSDPQKRAAYDRYGHQGLQGFGAAPGFDPSAFADFSDILAICSASAICSEAPGGARGRNRAQRGEDLRYDLEINLEDVCAD